MLTEWKIADRHVTSVILLRSSRDMLFKVYDEWEGRGTLTQRSPTTPRLYKWEQKPTRELQQYCDINKKHR